MPSLMEAEQYDLQGLGGTRTAHNFNLTFTTSTPLTEEQSRRVHEAIANSLGTSATHTRRHVAARFGIDLQVAMDEERC